MRRVAALSMLAPALVLASATAAIAQAEPTEVHHVEPPLAPLEHPPDWAIEMHGAGVIPFARGSLCPSMSGCVLGAGVSLGVGAEHRWTDGFGLLAGYSFWVLDSASVFEVGTLHALRVGARYTFDERWIVHPSIDAQLGALLFGDTTQISTGGGLLSLGGRVEIELSEAALVLVGAEVWLLSTGAFRTRDGVERARDFGVEAVLTLHVGLRVLVGSATTH